MRSQQDETEEDAWSQSRYLFSYETTKGSPANQKKASNSLSGKESNQLFLAQNGNYVRVSPVSGTDTRQDGRGFALLDYDNDGWIDLVQVNLTEPRIRLLRNELFKTYPDRKSLTLELVGSISNRDAIGAKVQVNFSDQSKQLFHVQSGRGFAAQSSRKIHLTDPENTQIIGISVHWPSGKTSNFNLEDSPERNIILNES